MIVINNLVKTYKLGNTTVEALNGLSVEIKRGDFICIAGSSGSGKTTFLNILGCLDRPDSGQYLLDDCNMTKIPQKKLVKYRRDYFGFIFQNFNLIPVLTAYENVEYPLILSNVSRKKRKELTSRALAEVGLYDRKDHKPDQLSGGQRQRVSIARSLVKRNPIVLADEPTANLDSTTGGEILELMKKLNENDNTTFIFSTHDKEVMGHSNMILHLKDGKIQTKGK